MKYRRGFTLIELLVVMRLTHLDRTDVLFANGHVTSIHPGQLTVGMFRR
jgi:hypothetical protein